MVVLLGAKAVYIDADPTPRTSTRRRSRLRSRRARGDLAVSYTASPPTWTRSTPLRRGTAPGDRGAAQSFGARTRAEELRLSTIGATSFFPSKPLAATVKVARLHERRRLAQAMREIATTDRRALPPYANRINGGSIPPMRGAAREARTLRMEVAERSRIGARYDELCRGSSQRSPCESAARSDERLCSVLAVCRGSRGARACAQGEGIPTAITTEVPAPAAGYSPGWEGAVPVSSGSRAR